MTAPKRGGNYTWCENIVRSDGELGIICAKRATKQIVLSKRKKTPICGACLRKVISKNKRLIAEMRKELVDAELLHTKVLAAEPLPKEAKL